jgi:NADP-dependent 3-hydroxy acid dehydrogenase YdfG
VATYAEPRAFGVTWSRREGRLNKPAVAGRWIVVGDEAQLRDGVVDALKAAGATTEATEVDETIADPGSVAGAIALFPLQRGGVEAADTVYKDLVALGEQLETWHRAIPARILVAGWGLARVLDEETPDPYGATAFGPVLVLPRECPGLDLRHVDMPPFAAPEVIATVLAREAADSAPAAFVAWRHGRRFVRGFEPISTDGVTATAMVRPGAVALIPGGLGAIGLALGERLARTAKAKLIITSRRPSEAAAARAVQQMRDAGGDAVVLAADLSDKATMARAIRDGEARFGPITSVFHSAGGAASDAIAFFKEDADIRAVMEPKIRGLEVLIDLLGERRLDQFIAMASINGVVGAASLSDYCAANAVLDAFVGSSIRPKGWGRYLAVGWGPWRDIGMAARALESIVHASPEVVALQRSHPIPPKAALDMLETLLATDRSHAIVLMQDITALELADSAVPPPVAKHQARRQASSPSREAPRGDTEIRLAAIWGALLGADAVGATDDFFALGGHSLLATRIIARVWEQIGARLSLRDIFERPTIRALAQRIDAVRAADEREELVL